MGMAEIILIIAVIFEAAALVRMKKYVDKTKDIEEENELLHRQIGQIKFLLDREQEKNDKLEVLVARVKNEKAMMEKRIRDVSRILGKTKNS